jgi:hypothetical protein
MVIDGVARRPGLALAGCTWLGFAAPAAVAVERAVSLDGPLTSRVSFASTGFGGLASLCLVVAAMLVLLEQLSSPVETSAVLVLAGVVGVSGVMAVVMTVVGFVVLPIWSISTPAAAWAEVVPSYLGSGALAALAAMVAGLAMRGPGASAGGA